MGTDKHTLEDRGALAHSRKLIKDIEGSVHTNMIRAFQTGRKKKNSGRKVVKETVVIGQGEHCETFIPRYLVKIKDGRHYSMWLQDPKVPPTLSHAMCLSVSLRHLLHPTRTLSLLSLMYRKRQVYTKVLFLFIFLFVVLRPMAMRYIMEPAQRGVLG